ncbi:MAG: alpha/beta fold hydrolase [Sandaracinaceae bacterium]|nr:alpha/beta fold hydrolase [Sandaracinaceae bacterium]
MSASGGVAVDGGELRWDAAGDGPPVLLIQGVGAAGCTWRPQVEGLRHDFRCVTFDNRGVGGTTAPVGAPTIEAMAEDALRVMDAQGWSSAHVAGHSMGGLIAQAVAIAAPDRVRSLALLNTFAQGTQGARADLSVMWLGARMRFGGQRGRRRAGLRMIFPDAYLATRDLDELHDEVAAIFGRDVAAQPAVVMKQLRAMGAYDPRPHAPAIAHLPALVLTGDADRIAKPEHSRELAARFDVEAILLEGTGHASTIQRAELVNTKLSEHWHTAESALR